MSIRQMAQPLGVGLAALVIPVTAQKYGLQTALLVPAFLCAGIQVPGVLGLLEGTTLAVALLVIASIVTVADNGLAFTSVAEIGGPYWSGRAMGSQNTGQLMTCDHAFRRG